MNTKTKIVSRGYDEYGIEILVEVSKPTWREVRRWKEGDYLYIEISGLTRHMRRNSTGCLAIYGSFQRNFRNLVYSTMYKDEKTEWDEQEILSEFLDDVDMLETGAITEWF